MWFSNLDSKNQKEDKIASLELLSPTQQRRKVVATMVDERARVSSMSSRIPCVFVSGQAVAS